MSALVPGMRREDEFVVDGRLLTDVGGTIGVGVLSTPGMIGMMERTAAMLVFPALGEGRATVGFEVCVRHVAGARQGTACRATAVLSEPPDGRRLRFDVEVHALDGPEPRLLGLGTHERRVIEVDRHAEALSGGG